MDNNINNTTQVNQGDEITMKCQTIGHPEPIIMWAYGDNFTTIPIGYGRFKMLPGGDLVINGAQIQDTGILKEIERLLFVFLFFFKFKCSGLFFHQYKKLTILDCLHSIRGP